MDNNSVNQELRSEAQLKEAIDSIAVIRRVFDRASVNTRSLAPLFLIMGGGNLLLKILSAIAPRFISPEVYGNLRLTASFILGAALLAVFLVRRKQVMTTENRYTMKLYNMWGTVIFGIYPLSLIVSLVVSFITQFVSLIEPGHALFTFSALDIVQFAAVCMCLYFTGLISEKRWLYVLAGVMIFGYVILFGIDLPYITDIKPVDSALEAYSYLSMRGSLANLFVDIIFLILGICFSLKRGGEGCGDN